MSRRRKSVSTSDPNKKQKKSESENQENVSQKKTESGKQEKQTKEVKKGQKYKTEARTTIAGVEVKNADKVLFESDGYTKADLAAHYERVADRMIPLVRDHLVSLVRCPSGLNSKCFYERHVSGHGFPDAMHSHLVTEKSGRRGLFACLSDLPSLVAGVQMGALEFHIWGSNINELEKPDRLVFDVDPGENVTFDETRDAAIDIRDRLAKIGLQSVPLLTGVNGIHVVVPLVPNAEWPEVRDFAYDFAKQMEEESPERYVAQSSKAKRVGRIFIDYLRNGRGATAVAPYSTRAKEGAPIATPVSWTELEEEIEQSDTFSIEDMEERMAQPDPWAESFEWEQELTPEMHRALWKQAK